jgi:hypothetical protein
MKEFLFLFYSLFSNLSTQRARDRAEDVGEGQAPMALATRRGVGT